MRRRTALDRLPLPAALALAALSGSAALAYGLSLAYGRASAERLPDLVQRTPYGFTTSAVRTARGVRFGLGFGSAVDNVGAGPLIVEGRRRSAGVATMRADQLIERTDGSHTRVPGVGVLRFTRSRDHQHWHLLGFERYSLRPLRGSPRTRVDRKTGFCLGDRYDARPGERLPGDPGRAVRTGECGRGAPRLLSIDEGISVGFGDDYHPFLEGQHVDVTGLPAGEYELVHRANADRRVRELDFTNNAASVVLRLTWPDGTGERPNVQVLERCGDGTRCRTHRR